MDPRVVLLEHLAFRAWPAAEVALLDGWRLRHAAGVSRRVNSVWPNACDERIPLAERVDQAAHFYRARGAAPSFQVGPLARPSDLDTVLEARGYAVHASTQVMTAEAAVVRVRARGAPAALPLTRVDAECRADWFDISGAQSRHAGHEAAYRGILGRIADQTGYALAMIDGHPAGVGLGVCQPPWLAILSMHTLAPFRRRGVASAILAALAEWGSARNAERLYLGVETNNAVARSLYHRLGFREAYAYHYRRLAEERT